MQLWTLLQTGRLLQCAGAGTGSKKAYRVLIDEVLNCIAVFQLLLCNQVVEVHQAQRHQLRNVGQPVQLPLGHLHTAFQM